MSAAQLVGRIRKALAALTAGAGVMVAAGAITGQPAVWITGALAAAGTALAVYAAPPNTPPPPKGSPQ